jgi:hypothetical protein
MNGNIEADLNILSKENRITALFERWKIEQNRLYRKLDTDET